MNMGSRVYGSGVSQFDKRGRETYSYVIIVAIAVSLLAHYCFREIIGE